MDILEHWLFIKFCMQAGKSPIETKRFLDVAGDDPNVYRIIIYKWNERFKDGRTYIFDNE